MRTFRSKLKKKAATLLAVSMLATSLMGMSIASANTGLEMPDDFTVTPSRDAFLPRFSMPTDVTTTTVGAAGYHWAAADIFDMMAVGSLKGYPDKMFRPNKAVTRAEFATAMTRGLQLPSPEDSVELRDLSEKHWAFKDVQKALPYLAMLPDGSFRPGTAATREDVAVALVMATGLDKRVADPVAIDLIFADYKTVSPDLRALVAVAVDQKLIKGYKVLKADGQYTDAAGLKYNLEIRGQSFVTRGEVAHLLNESRKNMSLGFKLAPGTELE
ncbi:MAG: S-layer homology domain-containing protein [Actinobacteria bacterium]|nr:S-layer homology domain-containing protein [Actinomycetota bacterium]